MSRYQGCEVDNHSKALDQPMSRCQSLRSRGHAKTLDLAYVQMQGLMNLGSCQKPCPNLCPDVRVDESGIMPKALS
ncbi:hypothetical protein PoB_000382700 [Plakobranchus ocellatus]|uniref:Uncharacterized protein n=1 Tax=Plakobranchus ocellatus TaxID=259542 RepID=A0AAV3Y4E6_9GAST|nr:hypothetical protein PoB_000382700 [Plakobranchus ocellatus]